MDKIQEESTVRFTLSFRAFVSRFHFTLSFHARALTITQVKNSIKILSTITLSEVAFFFIPNIFHGTNSRLRGNIHLDCCLFHTLLNRMMIASPLHCEKIYFHGHLVFKIRFPVVYKTYKS